MVIRLVSLSIYILFGINLFAQEIDTRAILQNHLEVLKKHRSMSYRTHYKYKSSSHEDTLELFAKCYLLKDDKDSVINGKFYIEYLRNSRITSRRGYKNNISYYIDDSAKSISTYNVPEHRPNPMEGNVADDVILQRFFKYTRPFFALDPENTIVVNIDTILSDRPSYHFEITSPDDEQKVNTNAVSSSIFFIFMLLTLFLLQDPAP